MKIFIINRADRPERLAHAREELQRNGLNAHRIEASIETHGWKGCRDSHLRILEENNNERYFIIIEDDLQILDGFHQTMVNAINELPADWDMLYLGANPCKEQEIYSPYLYRLNGAYCTHAIVWHPRPNGALEYVLEHKDEILKIDVFFSNVLMPKFNVFLTKPMIVTQKQFQSDTCQRSDVSKIQENYNKYCK